MKREKKYFLICNVSIWIIAFCISLLIYITNVNFVSFNADMYYEEFDKFNVWNEFSGEYNQSELMYEVEVLQAYLQDCTRSNEIFDRDFYGTDEKTHIVEVRNVFQGFQIFGDILIGICFLSLAMLFFYASKYVVYGHSDKLFVFRRLRDLLIRSGGITCILSVVFMGLVTIFPVVFYYFHVILFPTDTWMMNPATQNMIRMYPQGFFIDMFLNILFFSVVYGTIFLIIGVIMKYKGEKALFDKKKR